MDPIRGILHWPSAVGHFLSHTALPAVFGGGEVQQEPGQPNPLGAALSAAGATMAEASGGPRRFGEFGPTPLASIAAGLAAGREVYQGAREGQRRRAEWNTLTGIVGDPNSTPIQRRMAIFRALPNAPGQQADVLNRMLQLDAPTTPRAPTVVAPGASIRNPDGSWSTAPDRTMVPPRIRTSTVTAGGRVKLINDLTGEVIQDLGAAHVGGPKPIRATPQQQSSAELGAASVAAFRTIEQLRRANPRVETEVGRILEAPAFVRAVPLLHNAGDAATAVAKAGGSSAAQQYIRAKWGFMDNIIRTRVPGGRMTAALFNTYRAELMPGLDADANTIMRSNEIQALLSAQGQSGYDVNPDLWNAAARRHGVQDVDLASILRGGTGNSQLDAIQRRY